MLPPNASELERAVDAMVSAIFAKLKPQIEHVHNPDLCPVDMLPFLAWAMDVEAFDSSWPEAQQRAAIAASWQAHNISGTPRALKDALARLGLPNATLLEFGSYIADGRYIADGSITASGTDWAYQFDVDLNSPPVQYARADGSAQADGTLLANGYTAEWSRLISGVLAAIRESAPARCHLRQLRTAPQVADGSYLADGCFNADGGIITWRT